MRAPITALFALVGFAVCSLAALHRRDDNLPARVPYVFPEPGADPVADEIRVRRINNTLLDLDGVLLNSDALAEAWNNVAVLIRDNNPIPGDMRELFILRSAVLNGAAYQWYEIQHEPVGRSAGLTTAQLRTIRFAPPFVGLVNATSPAATAFKSTLTPQLSAALDLADWSTAAVHVPDNVYNNIAVHLNDTEIVFAVSTVGFYNWVSRFVVGLDIDSKMRVAVPIPQ
ncbi:4-carboxymuconolactone decarboxylase [Vararia minispora EC-137]|uniref:4-carboxymuconolactone decarboxylase n=1 Tax=Vararia minispora EC-137 TaxID=1314806 RepID=A0ACB8QG61_9AGAM|nr:4-carboxymuconolactone decarboxylase [Vararia minispora EC-137]